MKKKADLIFTALYVPVDFLMILLGALAAYSFRYVKWVTNIRPIIFDLPFIEYFIILLFVIPVSILILAWFGLYSTKRSKFINEISKIIQGCSTTMMLITAYMFFIREIFSSRFIIFFAWIFSILFLILGRIIMKLIQYSLRKKGIGINNIVIIGENQVTKILQEGFNINKHLGFNIKKIINSKKDFFTQLNDIENIDEIIITDHTLSRSISTKIIEYCQKNHITFKYVGGDFESKVTNNEVHTFAGIPIIELKRTPLDGWGKILKRILDIIGSIVGIIIFSPIMLITTILIKLDSKGPIIADIPPRAGQYFKPFKVYKFRSMHVGAHKEQKKLTSEREGLFKLKNDPRITRIGKFIRKTSIDEIPQFFNVLKGEMSLVGPRPHFLNEYSEEQKPVLDIKPGMSGIPQISGRSDLSFDEELKLDTYYIENWSLWLDIWILLKTLVIVFTKMKSAV